MPKNWFQCTNYREKQELFNVIHREKANIIFPVDDQLGNQLMKALLKVLSACCIELLYRLFERLI